MNEATKTLCIMANMATQDSWYRNRDWHWLRRMPNYKDSSPIRCWSRWCKTYILDFVDANRPFDFVFSSHCLEHMQDPVKCPSLRDWWQLVRPGGVLIVIVPDEDLYEQGIFLAFSTLIISTRLQSMGMSVGVQNHDNLFYLANTLPCGEILHIAKFRTTDTTGHVLSGVRLTPDQTRSPDVLAQIECRVQTLARRYYNGRYAQMIEATKYNSIERMSVLVICKAA